MTSRIDNTPGFVLHSYPFRETSLIVEIWTESHGRIPLVARGARRPGSAMRSRLMPFLPLAFSWSGKHELRTLIRAEWLGGLVAPKGLGLLCGFYVNELMIRLLARDDPHPGLFPWYVQALQQLATARDATEHAVGLRRFEHHLLTELGYAQPFDHDALHGNPIRPDLSYHYQCEVGAVPADRQASSGSILLRGKTLIDLARQDFSDPVSLQQSKLLMRHIINHHLGGQTLHARELLKDLQQL